MEEVQGNLMGMVLKFLAKSIGQASIAPHAHTHREIASLHKTCGDMLRVGLAAENASPASYARRRTVPRFRAVAGCAIQLDQHCIIYFRAKGAFDRISVNAMPVSRELNPISKTGSNVSHENLRGFGPAISEHVGNNQFAVAVQCSPRPDATETALHLFQCQILVFAVNERPYLVALQAPDAGIANVGMMIGRTRATQTLQQPQNSVLPYAQHAAGRIYGVSLCESAYDLSLFLDWQTIHGVTNIRDRLRIRQVQNHLDIRDRLRIDSRCGKEAKKPVCCCARPQGWSYRRSRARKQHDSGGAQ